MVRGDPSHRVMRQRSCVHVCAPKRALRACARSVRAWAPLEDEELAEEEEEEENEDQEEEERRSHHPCPQASQDRHMRDSRGTHIPHEHGAPSQRTPIRTTPRGGTIGSSLRPCSSGCEGLVGSAAASRGQASLARVCARVGGCCAYVRRNGVQRADAVYGGG